MTEHATQDQRDKLWSQLMRPLPGEENRPTRDVVDYERELFAKTMKRQRQSN